MLHMLAFAAQAVASSPFDWATTHIHLVGWPMLVALAWKASNYFGKLTSKVEKTVGQIDQMATNHFPHMEASLARQDVYLANIDKNIGRLADHQVTASVIHQA